MLWKTGYHLIDPTLDQPGLCKFYKVYSSAVGRIYSNNIRCCWNDGT